jgi:hypothetical protein
MAAAAGASAAAFVAGVMQQAELGHAGVVAAAAFVLVAWVAWLRMPVDTGVLAWDGQRWLFGQRPGRLSVAIDLGGWVLLRFNADETRRRVWLAASERGVGADWNSLRAAVYSRRSDRDDSDNANTPATRTRP